MYQSLILPFVVSTATSKFWCLRPPCQVSVLGLYMRLMPRGDAGGSCSRERLSTFFSSRCARGCRISFNRMHDLAHVAKWELHLHPMSPVKPFGLVKAELIQNERCFDRHKKPTLCFSQYIDVFEVAATLPIKSHPLRKLLRKDRLFLKCHNKLVTPNPAQSSPTPS